MKSKSLIKTNRRHFLAGSLTVAGAVMSSPALAGVVNFQSSNKLASPGIKRYKPVDLKAYHCSLVHQAIGEKLTRTIEDPKVSAHQTAKAITTAACPCCGTHISPINSTKLRAQAA